MEQNTWNVNICSGYWEIILVRNPRTKTKKCINLEIIVLLDHF